MPLKSPLNSLHRAPNTVVLFGVFEADFHSEELRKNGVKVRIQDLPFRALKLLLSRPNEVITREEFRQALWPGDVFVDFDLGIRSAIKRLRDALGDSAENPIFVETVDRRGYRWIAPTHVEPPREATVGAEIEALDLAAAAPPTPAPVDNWDWIRNWKVAGPVVAAAFALGAFGVLSLMLLRRHAGADSIAVLPFANGSGDANTDYLSDGITESLIGNLAHVPQLKVKSRSSVFRYKGKDVDAQKAGSELGVSALVSGRVTSRGDSIEVSAELIDVRDNTAIWEHHYSGKGADIVSLQTQIAGDIAGKLRSKLSSSEKQQVTRQGTQNPEAYDLYLKGRYAWNIRTYGELENAISYFNQAIAKDPGYALAYSGIADAYNVLPNYGGNQNEDFPKSNGAARKALELDPTLAHPHAVLGSNEMQYDWDFASGEAQFKKSFELDPNDATARQWYADDIAMIGGREAEAIAEVDRAHELEPLSPVISRVAASVRVWERRFDEAIAICTKLANDDPTFAIAHDCLAQAYWGKHNYSQVIGEWKTRGELSGFPADAESAAVMEQGFLSAGWKGAVARVTEYREAQRKNGYFSAFDIAGFYADLGDKEQAFHWLNVAYQEHDWLLISLKTNFRLDPIRSDPRFAELVRKVGLPQ
ncbi:MAG TPA: winged helix-turn-helix domain-containing protein [Terriglobales bacterium]|jgi:TolB-like protein/DNA-binding winged helix-turn-helix (wHTH) protein|nr:winged helix-turn-helix domain-containing protein [Terriglobales bacterium]